MKKSISIIFVLLFSLSCFAQQKVITGKVTVYDEFPISNVKVSAKKSKASVSTDANGEFTIVCEKKDVLFFNSKFFKSKRVSVKNTTEVFVNLDIAKGTDKNKIIEAGLVDNKDRSAFMKYNVDNKKNNFERFNNIYDLISSLFPSVRTDGQNFIIRGNTSLMGSSSAMIIVDGVESSDISYINTADVESIEVLKGSEASIYGVRGANGVIIINLK